MTGAQLLVECLVQHGVEVIFGMPGAHTLALYDALYRHPKIKHILVRHEESAALMADGYARATGRVGVCCVTSGPGVTNAATGLAVAHGDSIPVLLISSQVDSEAAKLRRGLFHATDQLMLTRPITKWNARADIPERIPQAAAEAFRIVTHGRRGAGHLEVPVNVLQQEVEIGPSKIEVNPAPDSRMPIPPLILAGGGIIAAEAWAELVEIAELLQAPVLMSPMGKGVIPADHPLCGGVTFTWVTADLQNMERSMSPLASMADTALAVGFRFSQLATVNYTLPGVYRGSRLNWMPDSARPQQRIDVGPAGNPPVHWWELRKGLNRDAIVAADIVRSGYALVGQFPVYHPRTFMHSASFIAMGHAFPAALGAKVAFPGRQVVSVSGDGGFLMTGQELATAVQHGINVVAIVINDRCLTGIAALQDARHGGRRIAVDLVNPDFVRLAESFGALGLRVTCAEEFKPALEKALRVEKPVLIEIVC